MLRIVAWQNFELAGSFIFWLDTYIPLAEINTARSLFQMMRWQSSGVNSELLGECQMLQTQNPRRHLWWKCRGEARRPCFTHSVYFPRALTNLMEHSEAVCHARSEWKRFEFTRALRGLGCNHSGRLLFENWSKPDGVLMIYLTRCLY